ncbi:Tetratricopeptide repeat protein [Rubrivivax sp. A210]|uniref:O-linked N-acetylglucosamine transferase family protein n=1 Tax=Rubrivivax sp. A210 TaxID=2772301 RepID=UPI001919345E|nr:tetratricopeptide repeat protein [Rubrivivax sp. A210]CAD5372464.1 Tetratricopeptide repeat protein [Rubrivivax sp. A210]
MPSQRAPKSQAAAVAQALKLQNQGLDARAMAAFRAILARSPDEPVALYSLAVLLMNSQATEEALDCIERGVKAAPGFVPMWFARGKALHALGRMDEALRSYEKALELSPEHLSALVNSGVMLREMHRHLEALERFKRVLEINPKHELALSNAGILLTETKSSQEAIDIFRRLLAINPGYPYGLGQLCHEMVHICDWTDHAALSAQVVEGVRNNRKVCLTLALMAISDRAEDQFLAAQVYAGHFFPRKGPALWQGEAYAHPRLRVAYISPDLREHPVGHLMAGIFERHDRTRVETFAYSVGIEDGSRLRGRIRKAFDHFIDVRGRGGRQIAELIRAHEIDVLIDLAGYTSDTRVDVFVHRPAPVQMTYLGYPGTLGSEHFDYLLADRYVIPPEHQPFYSEKIAYLPDAYLPTDASLAPAERTPTRAECGLPETGPVLCSFCHAFKINPAMFAAWMRILGRLESSVLWLVAQNELATANLRQQAQAHGVDPARLVFAPRVPLVEDHLARYRLADVFLDTSPYNAHTTAADALMVGLPVVTFEGHAFQSRVAGSLLHAIGLPELIANSLSAYEDLVVDLVSDRSRLAAVKAKLAANRATHPLFDTDGFCRKLEDVLLGLAGRPVQALPPPAAAAVDKDLEAGTAMLAQKNYPQAELHLRRLVRRGADPDSVAGLLGEVARGYGLAPDFQLVEPSEAERARSGRFMLIKAWGFGFWSDVHHVLGQLLLAELTGRRPVVHWGSNSLFGDGTPANAFEHFFEAVSPLSLPMLLDIARQVTVYPAKWQDGELAAENRDKWDGPGARLAAPYFFGREETLVVSDFYATVSSIQPWIGTGSRYHGQSDDQIYRELFARYLRPVPAIQARVDAFHAEHMQGRPWVAVHVRGTDKILESGALNQTNQGYFPFVDRIVELNPSIGLFLLTDSVELHQAYLQRYGARVLVTPARRSSTPDGVHMQGHPGRTMGEEVLVDALLAARCSYFVGNQESNVSLAVSSLKAWPAGFAVLLGAESARSHNFVLHQRR